MNRKSEEELQHIIRTYGNLLYRNAYVLLGNPHDVQDVLQEVLLKYMEKTPVFQLHDTPFLVGRSSEMDRAFPLNNSFIGGSDYGLQQSRSTGVREFDEIW